MSFGMIKKIREDERGVTFSGTLIDLETNAEVRFTGQRGLDNVCKDDVVTYTERQGMGYDLTRNVKVRLENYETASPDVQRDIHSLLLKMAKDKNMTDVIARKV